MAHERPRYIVERRSDTGWSFLGAHWTTRQWAAHLEHLRGRGWRVRVIRETAGQAPWEVIDLRPGDLWEMKDWA